MTGENAHSSTTEPAWLDDVLRATLIHIPNDTDVADSPPAEALADIARLIDDAWPHGHPPTVEELAADQGDNGSDEHRPAADMTADHATSDPSFGHQLDNGHLHAWHHHDDHSSHINPEPGPHL